MNVSDFGLLKVDVNREKTLNQGTLNAYYNDSDLMNVTCRIILCFSWKRVIFGWF
jgi:hypothetical protein